MAEEIWKDIPGYEGLYQVSNLGQVKSLPRVVQGKSKTGTDFDRRLPERILRPGTNTKGYRFVVLRKSGISVTTGVHSAVAAAFLGTKSNAAIQIRHLDGDRTNNNASNLRYGTASENQIDLYDYRGYHHRLTASDALEIRDRLKAGETGRALAKEFGVCESNISAIKKGRTFAWLK